MQSAQGIESTPKREYSVFDLMNSRQEKRMDEPLLIVEEEEEYSPIARLIELGRQKSYVTLDDILHFFPEAEQDVEQLEEAFAALLSAGIPFVEDAATAEPPA